MPRSLNELEGEAEPGGNADDGQCEGGDEKLKVVVRVRPLQTTEVPWSSTSNYALNEMAKVSSPHKNPRGNPTPASSNLGAESLLSIHGKSMTWEKNGQIKILMADAVFGGDATQKDLFHSVEDCIDGLLAGFDCSVFAYGQTGTGKTHTMCGLPHSGGAFDESDESFLMTESFGVVPRSIQKLFAQIDQVQSSEGTNVSFSVYCSFVEIYNERIYDILSADMEVSIGVDSHKESSLHHHPHDHRTGWNRPQPSKEASSLQIRQKLDGTVFVDGLTSRRVSSSAEMLRAFHEGSMNREVRDNLYNQHSSRGHSVFQVTLRMNTNSPVKENGGSSQPSKGPKRPLSSSKTPPGSQSRLSRLYFVDLAGSEKWHVNGSELSDKYAAELSSINKSLSALTNCVLALTQKERTHIPYRDSVLTRLLQSCLQGKGRTAFVVTVSPARDSLEESFATLRFAERLKALRCRPIRRKLFSNELLMGDQRVFYESQIQSMRMEVNRLRELLKKAQRRNQDVVDSSAAAVNAALMEENRRLKERLIHSERNRLAERGNRLNGKSAKGGGATRAGAAPQRQAARQILRSVQRPFSEDECTPKSIKPNGVETSMDAPPTAQAGRPNGRVVDHRQSDVAASTSIAADEKEYSTLVNQLHHKEARLHRILEAELEAHTTEGLVQSTVELSSGVPPHPLSRDDTTLAGKPGETRSWAVERVLRKNLVVVPSPVRGGVGHRLSAPRGGAREGLDVAIGPLPGWLHAVVRADGNENQTSILPGRYTGGKQDSPRHPMRTQDARLSSEVHGAYISLNATTQPSKVLPMRPAQSRHTLTSPSTESDGILAVSSSAKSVSILKLVGTNKSGRTKEGLVDEYKRARRSELEAVVRTLVHQ